MSKDHGLLLVTLLGLGLLSYWRFATPEITVTPVNKPAAAVPPQATPIVAALQRLAANDLTNRRELFSPPRDVIPLPPIILDIPPSSKPDLIAPPLRPAVALELWSQFYRSAAQTTPWDPTQVETASESNEVAEEKTLSAAQGLQETHEAYKKFFDWFRPNPLTIVFGKIVNQNKFDLGTPPREDFVFQEYDPRTGKAKGNPISWPPERVVDYGFAQTLSNRIEVRKRQLSYSAGRLAEVLDFAYWCLEQGEAEPKAYVEAERLFRKAREMDPGNPAGTLGLGKFLEKTFRLQEAYDLYESMTEGEFRYDPLPFLHLGQLQARLHMSELAAASIGRAVELDNSGWQAQYTAAQFFYEQDNWATAWEHLQAIRKEPTQPKERAQLTALEGQILLKQGKLDTAIASFRRSLQFDVEQTASPLGLAACYYAQGKFAFAQKEMNVLSAQAATSNLVLAAQGILQLRNKKFQQATKFLQQAIKQDPFTEAYSLSALAFLYWVTENREKAIAALQEAEEHGPDDPYVQYLKSYFLIEQENLDPAREAITKVLDRALNFVDALILRAWIGSLTQQYDAAEKFYARACTLDSKNSKLWTQRGINLLRGGRIAEAEVAFRAALAQEATNSAAQNGLGYCAYDQGRIEEALGIFTQIIDQGQPQDPYYSYAKRTFEAIREHLNKVLWVDDFERREILRDWQEDTRYGPVVSLQNGVVQILGLARANGETRFYREIPTNQFESFSVMLQIDQENQATVGVQIRAQRGSGPRGNVIFSLSFARLPEGKVAVRLQDAQAEAAWQELANLHWPPATPVKLTLRKVAQGKEPAIQLFFNDNPIRDPLPLQQLRTSAGSLNLGVFAETEAGRKVVCLIDNVEMVYRE